MEGKYIYGIIDSCNEIPLNITGLGGNTVYTMMERGVSCMVSDYSGGDFTSMAKEKIVRSLLKHQVVVEHVMKRNSVLPIKFGTVLATSDEVRNLLSLGHPKFVDVLAWIADKVEVEVAATWDLQKVLREISNEDEIVRAKEAIASGSEQQSLEQRIRLGKIVKASMDRRKDSYRERMIKFLKPLVVDIQPNVLISDEMVMNVAFLVEKDKQEQFDRQVRQLNELFHDQINFRIIGPLPPYSFAMVEVTKLSREEIDDAKQLLHLSDYISEPDVRKAYRHLAAETHPDSKPGDELAKMQFAKIHHAADLLIAYCRGQAKRGENLLINIRRQRDEELQHLRPTEIVGVAGATNG